MSETILIHFVGPHPDYGDLVKLYEARMVAVPRQGERLTFPSGRSYKVESVEWVIGENDHAARIDVTPAKSRRQEP